MHTFNFNLNKNNKAQKGDLLLAEPLIVDSNFSRSVILVCEHEEQIGSFGLILNKPSSITIENATDNLYIDDSLYIGGPVEQNTLHFIHTLDELEGSIALKNGTYWGGSYEQIKNLNIQGQIKPNNCRFFMGYTGWKKQQLSEELNENSWIIAKIDLSSLFYIKPENLWKEVMANLGSRYKMLTNYPIDPRLN